MVMIAPRPSNAVPEMSDPWLRDFARTRALVHLLMRMARDQALRMERGPQGDKPEHVQEWMDTAFGAKASLTHATVTLAGLLLKLHAFHHDPAVPQEPPSDALSDDEIAILSRYLDQRKND